MRAAVLLTTLALFPAAAAAQAEVEIITGFEGYPWGSTVANIAEIAGTHQVGERDGLPIYSAQLSAFGHQALAGFYFHPESGELLEGAYVFALTKGECDWTWTTVTRAIQDRYPGLQRTEHVPRRGDVPERQVYESDCEYFLYNDHIEEWTAEFTNPNPPGDRILMWMRSINRVPRLTVVYRGGRSEAWMEARYGG